MLFRRKKNGSLGKYRRIREIGRELTQQIMEHTPRFVLMRAATDLNLMDSNVGSRKALVFDSEEEAHCLMDRCFFDIYWEGKNAIEHFIESEAYGELTEEEQRVVQGMATAYYSLFEILGVARRQATLELADLLGEGTYTIMDLHLSVTAGKGFLLATRIHQIEGIYMATGAACPFRADQKKVLLDGLESRRIRVRKGKKRKESRRLRRTDYSSYFFRQYKRIGGIEFRTTDELR